MKKLLNPSSVGRMIVFFEMIMCAIWTLSVFMVNGADAISEDHISLLLLLTLTIGSIILLKTRKAHLTRAVLWIAILPILFISYQAVGTFLTPYEVHSLQRQTASPLLMLTSVR